MSKCSSENKIENTLYIIWVERAKVLLTNIWSFERVSKIIELKMQKVMETTVGCRFIGDTNKLPVNKDH